MFDSLEELQTELATVLHEGGNTPQVIDEMKLRTDTIERLIRTAVFASDRALRDKSLHLIPKIATELHAFPASINSLYRAFGKGEASGFSVPAFNIRTLTYDTARIIFRHAKLVHAGAFIFEIARSEMGYTMQRPAEYAACVLAAAIREDYRGPVFLQGDHFQVKKQVFSEHPEEEITALKTLISESLAAHFYNIDIDASTIVDLSKTALTAQQEQNSRVTAQLTQFIREHQPPGVTVSIGGEIGHIGGKNSTVADFKAFMDQYLPLLNGREGISKVSVQTGTSHGGVPLPDGGMADIALDFSVLSEVGSVAREQYGLGGAVQHGASTLPNELFDNFVTAKTLEVHLATGFQNIVFDTIPESLREEMEQWTAQNMTAERSPELTDKQFIYKFRKKSLGPFKRQLWDLSDAQKTPVFTALEQQFLLLFDKLHATHNLEVVARYAP